MGMARRTLTPPPLASHTAAATTCAAGVPNQKEGGAVSWTPEEPFCPGVLELAESGCLIVFLQQLKDFMSAVDGG